MRATQFAVCSLVCLVGAATLRAQGLAHNKNYIVLTADQQLAEDVLQSAQQFREQLANRWFGKPLPTGAGRTIIHIEVARDGQDRGLTWLIDSPQRKHHKVWLVTNQDRATGSTLQHEILHTLFATRYPEGLPAWIDEGAASLCDDAERFDIRRRVIDSFVRTGNWPDLRRTLNASTISKTNREAYSVAATVTQFLLTRGDRSKFLKFAVTGRNEGWDVALRQHYGMRGIDQLQQAWQQWARQGRQVAAVR